MRKWMRDRLKRRKKPEDDAPGKEPTKAPLQPAYFETENPVAESPATREEPEPPGFEAPHAEPLPEDTPEDVRITEQVQRNAARPGPQGSSGDVGRRRRRRRGRGGRGRGRDRSTGGGRAGRAMQTSAESPEADTPAAPELIPSAPEPSSISGPPIAAPARASKGVVVLAIGLPGSGKSSWFKRHNIRPLSSDLLRGLLFDDPEEQRFQDLVFSNLRSMLKARLIARRPTNYVDATNLTPHERHSWIKLAKDFGYDVQAVFFDVPVEVCLDRNRRRKRVVGEDVMRRMAGKLRPPTFEEGFSKITMVRVKKKE
jgi:predicted kinase